MRLLVLLFLGRNGGLPASQKQYKDSVSDVLMLGWHWFLSTVGVYLPLRVHGGADIVAAWFLLDGWRDNGGMGDAGLVEAVWWRGHHVRGETAGHQAARAKRGNILTA